jgi:hypothetical protein
MYSYNAHWWTVRFHSLLPCLRRRRLYRRRREMQDSVHVKAEESDLMHVEVPSAREMR